MKNLILLLLFLPVFCFGQAVPGCYNYVSQTPITATSNTTISGFSINCGGAATPGITIPAGVHDVHITKCKILNSATANGLINIGSGCYNITIDTCFLQSGWRGVYAVGATNNIHICYNYFYNIIDPNVTATASDGGGSSVQLNACTGTSIQVLDNRSFHDVSGAGVGDQFSLYKCNGTAASPIRLCRNQALNGSTNPPNTGYAGAVGGDGGGGYQRLDSNIFVNTGAVGAQIQGGHDIDMSYNTIFLAQASYTSVGIAFGNYSGLASSNVTISYNNTRCVQPSGSVFNYWFDSKTAYSPTGWATNTTNTGLNANILPNPLWSNCTLTIIAPNIAYSPAAYTFTAGVAITPFTPTNTGSIAAFTAALPAGLTINPSTGTISGTPTAGSAPSTYTVTAINTSGSSTATLTIGVLSNDATLTNMTISAGTLSPSFCYCTTAYSANVANNITSITITPWVNQANATVTVNGTPVSSGSSSGAVNLTVGINTINIVVTAQDGLTTKTYTVTVTRAPATDATLSSLALSSGALSPVFAAGTTSYSLSVDNTITSITLMPTANQANASIIVNGTPVSSGSASNGINLAVGSNTITTVVTAQDGVTKITYTVTVTRPAAISVISFNPIASATYGDSPVTLSASSNNTDAGANITFTSDNALVATVSGNTLIIVGPGTANITASQAATANFTAASDVRQSLTVNQAILTITANDQSKFYGWPFSFTGTEFTVQGLLKSDMVTSVTLSSAGTAALSDPGTYPISAGTATGIGLANYNISYVTGTLTVNAIALTFDAIPSKVYNMPDFSAGATSNTAITYTSSNTNVATIVSGNVHIVGAGSSIITATAGIVSQTQTLTVSPAPLTITAKNVNKIYGTTITGNSSSTAFTASGLQNSETIGSVAIAYSNGAAANAAANTYTASVIPSAASGGTFNPANYDITYTPGDLVVGQAALDITASNAVKVYGDTQTFTGTEFTVTGLKNSDAIASVSLISDGAPASANVNNYAIIASAAVGASGTDLGNYNITYHNGTDAVSPANLIITASNQSKVYGATQVFEGTEFTAAGLLNGDGISGVRLSSSGAPAPAHVSVYDIIASNPVAAQGTDLSNYSIAYVKGTDAVGTAVLTITADDQSIAFGDQIPVLSASYSGFVNGETAANLSALPTLSTTATAGSPVGNYIISVSGAADNDYAFNYVEGNLSINAIPFTFNNIPAKVYGAPDFDPGAVSSSPISYTSSNPLVATIASGNIHIVGAGSTTITADDGTNQFSRTLTVAPAALSITADNQSRVYGSANPSLTVSYNGFVNGDTPASLTAAPIVATPAAIGSAAGTYTITASGAASTNYVITFYAGILSVGKAALSITADDQNKTYGSANPVLTASYGGFVNGDTPTSLTTSPNVTTTANSGSPAGTYPIHVTGAVDANYNITYNAGTLTVGRAALSITADDQSKTQGSVNPILTVSYSGFVNGDTNANLTTQPAVATTAVTGSPIGTYPITVSGAADANYDITFNAGTLTIAGLALNFGPIPSKVYGAPDFNPGATSSSPITYTSSNPAVATISGGNAHIVGVGSTTISANDGTGNINQTLTVTPAALTISADDQFKVYGASNPPLTVSYNGFVNGENEASLTSPPIVLTTAGVSSGVGNYSIAASGATDANYTITYTAGTLVVGQAPLIITANNLSKTAGAVNPVLTVSYNGFVNGDTPASLSTAPIIATTANTASPSGTYPITVSGAAGVNYNISYKQGTLTVSGLALTFGPIPTETYGTTDFGPGATSSNSITYTSSNMAVATIVAGNIHVVGVGSSTITANDGVNNMNQLLTVTPVSLLITASNKSKTYGAVNPALTVSYSGFVNGDTQSVLTTPATVSTTAAGGSPVGPYPINVSGAAAANYSIAYANGTITIVQAALTITANNQTKVQGAANPTLTVSYNGFVNGDAPANFTTPPTITTTATTSSPVGPYPITAAGAVDANYSISYVQGTLTVTGTPLAFGPIPSKVYGTADFGPGATSGNSITYTSSNSAVAIISSGNIHIVGVGTSLITANDGTSSLQQTLTVTAAPLSITASNVNKTYGATLAGAAGSSAFSPSGLATGETIGSVTIAYSTGSAATAAVGTYTGSVTPSAATGGTFNAANYTITYNSGNIVVGAAALTITASNVNKPYGTAITGAAGSAAFGSSGLVNGQTIGSVTIAYGTGAAATAAVATYTGSVTASAATGGTFTAANYTITYNAGNIVVTPVALTITANNQTKVQGTANPALTAGYVGFVNSETNTALSTQPTISTTAVTGSPVGTYPITATGAVDGNYTISYVAGTLTVTAANTLTFGPIPSKVYGAADFSPGATGSGTITYTSSNTAVATIASGNIHIVGVGSSTITASNGTSSLQQTLTVTAAALSITANNVTKTYGGTLTGAAGSAAFSSSGLVNGQTIGSVTIAYGTGSAATAAAATYTGSVTPSAATGGTFTPANYTITYHAGNITVNKAALTITANNASKVQGTANPALSVSYSGFVNSETSSVLTTQPTVTTTAITTSPVGTYPITASGAAAANYSFTYVAGTLTVTAANSLTFAPIPSKVYGTANFAPGATGSGTITYTSSNTAVATIVTGNIHIVGVGTSTITASNGTSSLQQTLTVTPAPLTITANSAAKTYGTLLTTWVGATSFTSTGLVNSETIATVTITYGTGSAAAAAAGTYTGSAVPSAATGGTFKAANYTITYVSAVLTVNKAVLTITAGNVSKAYGTAIAGGSGSKAFTTTGLQNSQTIGSATITYGTGAAATANAGSYTGSVVPSAATGGTFIAADYTISYVSGNITVTQVSLKITANNQTKIQGKANPTLTVSYTGFVNSQTSANLTTQPRVTTTATTSSPVGTYPITASGAVDPNYAITYVAGTLTINPSTASVMSVNNLATPDISMMEPEPIVKQAVSPNGDGINDVLIIENIEYYPDNKVVLINRNGAPIYEIEGYDNVNKVFDGRSNITKAMQQPGTYFYVLEYKVRGELKRKTNYFVIKY